MLNQKMKILVFVCFFNMLFAQSLSNDQIDAIKAEFQSNNVSEAQVENKLADVNLLPMKSNFSQNFGYSYFQKDVNFFDNIPAPPEFKIGPGDELFLSLWGETNVRKKFIINKDGAIFYQNIGFINLNNKTLQEAESILSDRLSQIYSTINNEENLTELSLELGQLRSINVYFTGETKNPGINRIHPMSDIFSALAQTGIKETGSLRNVQLIRKGEIVHTFDFYTFFVSGQNNFSKFSIFDGDVIHIPVVANRVQIQGGTTRLGYFELIDTDTISDLFKYAGGLKAIVSDTIIVDRVIPANQRTSDDNARSRGIIPIAEASNHSLNNGDSISIPAVTRVETDVTIYGKVKNSGGYPAKNMTLKDILKIAGGIDDPVYRKSMDDNVVVLRKDANQFYSKEFKVSLKDADSLQLSVGDKIFVYENINYSSSLTYRVQGQVNKPGTFPLKKGITVREALNLAGGPTDIATLSNFIVSQEITELDELENQITYSKIVGNANLDFELGPNSVINVLPLENVISVEGNVYNPGLVAYKSNLTMSKAIALAGGYKPKSLKKRAYVRKANGAIEKTNLLRGRGKSLDPGDTIIVPLDVSSRNFDPGALTADLLSILTNLVAIFAIVSNNSD